MTPTAIGWVGCRLETTQSWLLLGTIWPQLPTKIDSYAPEFRLSLVAREDRGVQAGQGDPVDRVGPEGFHFLPA